MRKLLVIISLAILITASYAQDFKGLKKINGTQLYFNIIGEGEPIVIVHGGPGMSHDYFLPHIKSLAKKHKVVLYDQRACGKSFVPSTDSISMDFFVNDLEAIRKVLGVDKLNLLGHSWGALLAINYGIKYPDNVDHLILSNPVPLSREYDKEMTDAQRNRMTSADSTDRSAIIGSKSFREGKVEAYRKMLVLSFRNSFHKAHNFKKLQVTLPANYSQSSKALFTGLDPDLKDYNYYSQVGGLSFPVLIMFAQQDVVPMEAITKMQEQFKNAEIKVFRKSGHFIFIEETKKFTNEVTKLLKN